MASSIESLEGQAPSLVSAPSAIRSAPWVHWTLRIGVTACFVGHGAFGIVTKAAWLPFFAVAGIGADWAYRLMPLVGTHDIALGLLVLWRPRRALLAWLALWCAWTALLRPLAGVSGFEFLERAGNYGVPLAMLLGYAPASTLRGWLAPVAHQVVASRMALTAWTLRLTVFLLLVGHGALALGQKPLLVSHLAWLGIADPGGATLWMGVFELGLAAAILVRPLPPFLLVALVWKLGCELLFPLSGDSFFEFIERGGSYAAPLALYLLQRQPLEREVSES